MIVPVVGTLAALLLILIGTAISLAYSLLMPAMITHVVIHKSFARVFKVGEWWTIWRANAGGFLLCLLVIYGLGLAINFAFQFIGFLVIICCPLFIAAVGAAAIYLDLIIFPLYAQVYRDGVQKAAEQATPMEEEQGSAKG
jgi:hypothetical protein